MNQNNRYFYEKNGQVGSYNPLQIQQGLAKGLKELTDKEVEDFLDPPISQEQLLQEKISEYKAYLSNTDHKFLNGYVAKPDEDLVAIKALRDEKREFIRLNEGV